MYLLDVLDGILPAVTEPKDAGQQDQYQEERRLFYVAVTRARNRLYLFACRNRESAFADELRRELPREYIGPEDVFASLNTEPCGKHYRHAEKGGGVIRACCPGAVHGGLCLRRDGVPDPGPDGGPAGPWPGGPRTGRLRRHCPGSRRRCRRPGFVPGREPSTGFSDREPCCPSGTPSWRYAFLPRGTRNSSCPTRCSGGCCALRSEGVPEFSQIQEIPA